MIWAAISVGYHPTQCPTCRHYRALEGRRPEEGLCGSNPVTIGAEPILASFRSPTDEPCDEYGEGAQEGAKDAQGPRERGEREPPREITSSTMPAAQVLAGSIGRTVVGTPYMVAGKDGTEIHFKCADGDYVGVVGAKRTDIYVKRENEERVLVHSVCSK